MNTEAIRTSVQNIEACEKYHTQLQGLIRKFATAPNDTYTIMKLLMTISPWDSIPFGQYLLPPDILIKALVESETQFAALKVSSRKELKRLVEEATYVESIDAE